MEWYNRVETVRVFPDLDNLSRLINFIASWDWKKLMQLRNDVIEAVICRL